MLAYEGTTALAAHLSPHETPQAPSRGGPDLGGALQLHHLAAPSLAGFPTVSLAAAVHYALPALAVAIPLVVAAALVAANAARARRLADAIAVATAVLVATICLLVLIETTRQSRVVLWFGGWTPRHGVAIGIAFAIDPVGAGMALLATVLVGASLLFSWRYFEAVGHLYHTLMLVFLAAMVGFCFTGDLFNLFVFFELMSVAGFALAGYMIEEPGPLQGAINFGVTNTVGGFCILTGIGLLYGATGALNLAQLGQALAHHPDSRLMVVAMTLILGGFLIKAAAVPFHFWLADAHAVAPTPVCVLFSGVMVELGLYAVARVYWTVFWPAFGDAIALRVVLLGSGLLTMVVGGLEALAQQHLKRLLAFSTISHVGMFMIGISLLTPDALAAVAVFIAAHGLLKGSLFQSAGILMHRFDTIDEGHLHGRGRGLPVEGVVFGVGALCLAGLPLAGSGLGHELLDDAVTSAQLHWLPPLLLVGGALPAAAVVRAAAHIYLGVGRPMEPKPDYEGRETASDLGRTPVVMLAPCATLLAASVALAWVARLPAVAEAATRSFQATGAYAAQVLQGAAPRALQVPAVPGPTPEAVMLGAATVVLSLAIAAVALFWDRLPTPVRGLGRALDSLGAGLHRVQSGIVTDYVTWVAVGMAAYGTAFAVMLR